MDIYNMTEEEHDAYVESLPLCDEWSYPILTDENGDEILDDWGEPIRTGFGCTQVDPVDVVSHTTLVVSQSPFLEG